MVSYRCDRCKKPYDRFQVADRQFNLYEKQPTPSNYFKKLDLCPDCLDELKKWFEKAE